ncbi:hypothetical protein C8F01DRAFT_1295791 [Mycena amicta]|nr:hypothetical protein C8F01DRAFT_1295791 [Mycena amicta]
MPTYKYDPNVVPSAMPLPRVAGMHELKNDRFAIPDLNSHQRGLLSKVILPKYDLSKALTSADHTAIKKEALASKAFQHQSSDLEADKREENDLAGRIAAQGGNGPAGEAGVDQDAVRATLRGFPMKSWDIAIQRVITNANNAGKTKAKAGRSAGTSSSTTRTTPTSKSQLTAGDATRILDLIDYTARKKFANDQHLDILDLARTYEGSNAGANFNKAEKVLWDQADHKEWEAALQAELSEISPAQRMAMLRTGVANALSKIQDTGRFPPFVATMQLGYLENNKMSFEVGEALPADVKITPGFHEQHEDVSEQYLAQMHEWAVEPLKEISLAKNNGGMAAGHPVFELTTSDLEQMMPAALSKAIGDFLAASFEFVHATRDIPWGLLKLDPELYFDSSTLELGLSLDDPSKLPVGQRFEVAAELVRVAGPGTPNFFRPRVRDDPSSVAEKLIAEERARKAAEELEAEEARKRREADEAKERELVEQKQREEETRKQQEEMADEERKQREAEEARKQREDNELREKEAAEQKRRETEEQARKQTEENDARAAAEEQAAAAAATAATKKKRGRKERVPPTEPLRRGARERVATTKYDSAEPAAKRQKTRDVS